MRWQTPLAHMRRTATRDTELMGQRIARGRQARALVPLRQPRRERVRRRRRDPRRPPERAPPPGFRPRHPPLRRCAARRAAARHPAGGDGGAAHARQCRRRAGARRRRASSTAIARCRSSCRATDPVTAGPGQRCGTPTAAGCADLAERCRFLYPAHDPAFRSPLLPVARRPRRWRVRPVRLRPSGRGGGALSGHADRRRMARAARSPAAYDVLRHEGTERPGSSPLNDEHRAGTFACAGCAQPAVLVEDQVRERHRLAELLGAAARRRSAPRPTGRC